MAEKFQEDILEYNRKKGYYALDVKHLPDYADPFVPRFDKKQINDCECVCLQNVSVRQIHYNPEYPNQVSIGVHWPYFAKEWINVSVPIDDFIEANPNVGITFPNNKMKIESVINTAGKEVKPFLRIPMRRPMVSVDFYDKDGQKVFAELPPEYLYVEYEAERKAYKDRQKSKQSASAKDVKSEKVFQEKKVVSQEKQTSAVRDVQEEAQEQLIVPKAKETVSSLNKEDEKAIQEAVTVDTNVTQTTEKQEDIVREELMQQSDELAEKVMQQAVDSSEKTAEEFLEQVSNDAYVNLSSLGIDPSTWDSDMFSL